MKLKLKFWPIFSGVLLIVFFIVIFIKFSNLKDLFSILKNGLWYYVIFLLVIEWIYFYNQAKVFAGIFSIFGSFPQLKNIIKIFLSANFINMALPSGGISGMTLFVQTGALTKTTRSQATVINILYYLINYGSFSAIMILGLIFLFTINKLQTFHYIGAGILLLFVSAIALIFYIGYKNQKMLYKIMQFLTAIVNKIFFIFKRKNLITIENIKHLHYEILFSIKEFQKDKHSFLSPFIFSLIGHFLQMLILYLCFLAFGTNPQFYIIVIGYIFSVIFILVSPTPSGIGIVEPTMAITMSSLGTPIEAAGLATFVFRGIVFWLPFFAGFYTTRTLNLDKLEKFN